jgi:hypothetical protein
MKKQSGATKREAARRRGRKSAQRCPCCEAAPCACEKNCFCQELKAGMLDDDDDAGPDEEIRFSFLRHEATGY